MPLRDIALSLVIFGLLPICLMRPWVGILTWHWIGLMNPHRLTFGFAYSFPFAMLAGGTTLIGWLITRDKKPIPWNRELVLIVLMCAFFALTSAVAWQPVQAWDRWFDFVKVILMAVIGTTLIYGRDRIRLLIIVIVLSLGFYGFKGGIWVFLTGGVHRVQAPEGSSIGGNTFLGLALVMVLPLMMALAREATKKEWWRWLFLSTAMLSILSTIFTYSRGALLGLVVVLPLVFLRSKRKFLIAMLMVPTLLVGMQLVPEGLYKRADTIVEYDQDRSAVARLHAWSVAWNIAKDRPLTGAGFEFEGPATTERWRSYGGPELGQYIPSYQAAHSIYFQVLGQHGFIGLGLWLLIMLFAMVSLRRLIREHTDLPEHTWIANYAAAIQAGLVGYLVSGAFLNSAYFDLVYLYVTFTAILGRESAAIKAEGSKVEPMKAGGLLESVPQESLDAVGAARPRA